MAAAHPHEAEGDAAAAEPEEPPIAMDGVGQEEPLAALLASEN